MRKGLVSLVAVVLVAGSCARVPDSGPAVPVAIPGASQGSDAAVTSVNANIPRPTSDVSESVQAYVNALATTRNPGPLGDRYLATPALRTTFSQNPSMVVVRERSLKTSVEPPAENTATATFTADLVGTVDSNGVFQEVENPDWKVQVRMSRVGGVWLFAEPPPLVVDVQQFALSFSEQTVYYAAKPSTITGTNPRLVIPERRWINSDIGDQTTQIVDFVLAGPSEPMSRVARNPLPNIKRTSRVKLENGDLIIELEAQAEAASKEDLNAFVAEVGWSLENFSGAVQLRVGGRPLDVKGFEAVQNVSSWRRYNPAIIAHRLPTFQLQNGTLRILSDPANRYPPKKLGTPVLSKVVRSAAMSIDLARLAVVRDDAAGGQRLWIADASGTLQPTLRAPAIGRPTWGGNRVTVLVPVGGRVFEVGVGNAAAPSEIQVVGPGGQRLRDITSIRLSVDGVRALFVAGSGDDAKVYVGTLSGSTGGATVLVAWPLSVDGVPLDVSWFGPLEAVVAVRGQGNRIALVFAPVDGSPTDEQNVGATSEGTVRVSGDPTGNPDSAQVLLEVNGKRLVLRQGGRDSDVPPAPATAPFYPG